MAYHNNVYLELKSAAGVTFARLDDFEQAVLTRGVNEIWRLDFTVRDKAILASLEHKSEITLWRRDPINGLPWTNLFRGFFLGQRWEITDPAKQVTITALNQMWLLGTRVVAWPAETIDRSKFIGAKAETVMKNLVKYNAGSDATAANGRARTGTITGLTVQTDGANGNTIDFYCAWDNLLEALQKVARIGGGDFLLVGSPTAPDFRWFTGQLGTDRTSTVKFSIDNGNITNPVWNNQRASEKTVAIVGGDGVGDFRQITTTTSGAYSSSNDTEVFVNASDVTTSSGRTDRGKKRLDETKALSEFTFDVVQTPAYRIQQDYFLGDKVSVINPFSGASLTAKIMRHIYIFSPDGSETIKVDMESV